MRLTCRARLGPGDRVTRRVLIEGAEASGAGLICDGAVVGREGQATTTRAPTIAIWSRRDGEDWSRPRNILIRGCHVHGAIRVWGVGAGQRMDELRQSSYRADHTGRLQAAAPATVRLEDVTITGTGSIPLYVGPGVTGLSLTGSRLDGRSVSTAIYLDAESGLNTVSDNTIAVRTGREVIAVDGSAGNVISGNSIALSAGGLTNRGGVFLYRNCGEGGIVRHQTPSNNRVTGNTFHASWFGPARAVVVGSREGNRRYCDADAGHPFGSSVDDGDGATGNVVEDNRIERGF
ncbi:MAG: right-handed parallel beta-helix repeat-containing protein [Brevundimonas sp.]|uniref:right-handed parallel beta-helix repeat-containing protein n=1 Tax=Brevundimonas sp. TaxID=1871086 RepID=UPI0039187518